MHKSAGNAIPFEGAADEGYELTDPRGNKAQHPPMSADLIRWLFCRSNPANNVDFGPGPAEELRAKFTLKLWNTYAFFCNYARLDDFDPASPQVPLKERSDLDRWILSDLQKLIQTARKAFGDYNVMAFCLEAERFVDDKLSNWYVRRNRRRFWKSEQGTDKLAAYQTLYAVLMTLTKLAAPVMPFLAETMYQNLKAIGEPESVHLCAYPEVEAALIDEQLSADMNALLRLVSLGSAARNSVKIKVRQPLAEMKVKSDTLSDRRAIERFADQICEELNVKKVTIAENNSPPFFVVEPYLVRERVKFDFGSNAGQVMAALDKLPKEKLRELADQQEPFNLPLPSGKSVDLAVPHEYFELTVKGLDGWAAVDDYGTIVGLDSRISDALKKEGMAREVVRHVQELRKSAKLELEDRIALHLATESANLKQAIAAHKDYISAETLTKRWSEQPLNGEVHRANVKVDGQALTIELSKVT
jgi:isoleucyl-tRNA synthetase